MPTIRGDMVFESDRIRDADFEHLSVVEQSASIEDNAAQIARFLDINTDKAINIASTPHLFAD